MATTATPGSAVPTVTERAGAGTDRARLLLRFSRTERALHWTHAAAFLVLLGSGLVLYFPGLSTLVGRRPVVKDVHVYTGLAWTIALALIVFLGDTRGLARTAQEIERFSADDRRWLRRLPSRTGRFNAGQKLNAALSAALAVVFAVTGLLLWLGERDTAFRLASTVVVHDALTILFVVLLVGHLYLAAVNPRTRHALRGMATGRVRADWARAHHPGWADEAERDGRGA